MVYPQASRDSTDATRKVASSSPAGKASRDSSDATRKVASSAPAGKATSSDKDMIPLEIFEQYEEFRLNGEHNALFFFVINPQYDKWGSWIMKNYDKAAEHYKKEINAKDDERAAG